MRKVRVLGACAVASLALSGLGVATASAEEYPLTGLPELGRCVKVTLGTGHFNRSNCIARDKDGNDGEYDWQPGPNEQGTIKLHLNGPEFETVAGNKIRCSNGFLTGEYTNGKELKITNTILQGCLNVASTKICYSNPLTPGTVESNQEVVGEIGFIPNPLHPNIPWVGFDLKGSPEGLPLLTFNCGEELGTESITFEGSVIGRLKVLNKMVTSQGAIYKVSSAGHQQPEAFKGGVTDVLTEKAFLVSNPLKTTSEQAALIAAGELLNGEPIEIKAKQR